MPEDIETARDRLVIAAYRTASGGTQVQIAQLDSNGSGWGHRLAGPKHHNQGTTTLTERDLDASDAAEIRRMLDAVFPATVADKPVIITPAAAAHVLFQENLGGYPAGSYITKLLTAWWQADDENALALSLAYPAYGAAIDLLRMPNGLDKLRAIAGDPR
jgi:hypothetical protein